MCLNLTELILKELYLNLAHLWKDQIVDLDIWLDDNKSPNLGYRRIYSLYL